MKRKFREALVLVLMIVTVLALTGCAKKDPILGTWKSDEMSVNGQVMGFDEAEEELGGISEFSIKFEAAGTFVMRGEGGEGTAYGDWEKTGDSTYVLSFEGEDTVIEVSGNSFVLEGDGGYGLIFRR